MIGGTLAKVFATVTAVAMIPAGWPTVRCVGPGGRVRVGFPGFRPCRPCAAVAPGPRDDGSPDDGCEQVQCCERVVQPGVAMLPPEERNDHSAHRPGVVWGPRVIVPIPSGDAERHAWAGWKYLLPPSDLIILLCRFTC